MSLPRPRRSRVRLLVALALLAAASLHFVATEAEARLIPAALPWRRQLVLLTGVAEIAGALGLLLPRTRRAAAYALVALLILIFPANINHAVNNLQVGGPLNSPIYQWGRLPFQALFIWLVLWCAAPDDPAIDRPRRGAKEEH